MLELNEATFENFLAEGKGLVRRTDLEPGAFAAIGFFGSMSTKWPDDLAEEAWKHMADSLKEAEPSVHIGQKELGVANWFSSFSIYHAYAIVFSSQVVDLVTKFSGLSSQKEFETSIQKIATEISSASKRLRALEYSSAQSQNLFMPERKDQIKSVLSAIEDVVLEEFGPDDARINVKTEGEPFLTMSLSNRLSRVSNNIETIADQLPKLESKRTPSGTTHMFLQCLAQLWTNVKGKPASAEGNNKLDNYNPPFVRFVHTTWVKEILGVSAPSISTIRRHLHSFK
ncbi:MAG: hypothetical protein AAGE37_08685 [Pseudomonadota bacterium]